MNVTLSVDTRLVHPTVKLGSLVAPVCNVGASSRLVELICLQEGYHCGFINLDTTYTTKNVTGECSILPENIKVVIFL